MTNEEKAKLLKPEDVAHELMVSDRTIRRWLREGKIKGVRAGRAWRIRPEAVEEFIEKGGNIEQRRLTIYINPGAPSVYVHDELSDKDAGMPDGFWQDFASKLPTDDEDYADVADMIRNAVRAIQYDRADMGEEATAIICHSCDEIATVTAGSDQPNRDGACPICRDPSCEWEIILEDEIEHAGYTTEGMPTIFINNHGDNNNLGVLVDGEWDPAVREVRKKAGIKE